ncbi:MAG: response regulator [Parvibaculaceae bacterium]
MDIALNHSRGAVLIVDDEFLVREFAAEALRNEGYETLEASDAEEALNILWMRPEVHTLFTDVNMPGPIDGLALAHIVRRRRPDMRVVVTSGLARPTPEDLPEEGIFLPKPYHPDVVAKAISGLDS